MIKKVILLGLILGFAQISSAQVVPESEFLVGDNELIILPTARVMPKGQMYFSAYQVVILNLGYSITNTTQISLLSWFPVTTQLLGETFTLGIKQQLWKSQEKYFISVSGFVNPKSQITGVSFQSSNLFSESKTQIHINIGWLFNYEYPDQRAMLNGIGLQYNLSKKVAFVGEVLSASNNTLDLKESIEMLTAGFRWRSESLMVELAGVRPLEGGMGDLIMYPLLKGMIIF